MLRAIKIYRRRVVSWHYARNERAAQAAELAENHTFRRSELHACCEFRRDVSIVGAALHGVRRKRRHA